MFKRSALVLASVLALWPVASGAQQLIPATTNSIAVAGTVAASTKIISGISGRYIYITAIALVPTVAGATALLNAGTGTNCGTNTTALTGTMTFVADSGLEIGTGYGALLTAPAGYDVCITIGTQAAPGFISYALF